jgi:thiol-disulfide isomerase/thioredoxin
VTAPLTCAALALLAIVSSCQDDSDSPAPAPAPAAPPPAVRQISGRLVGHDGHPMKLAHVHLATRSVTADPGGTYRITVPAGLARLRFTGVDHAEHVVPIADSGDVELDVTLGTNERPDRDGDVTLVVVEPPPQPGGRVKLGRRIAMQRRADGTFVAEIEHAGAELGYELDFGFRMRTVNGPQADRFTYDGDGDYVSHVAVRGGRATIVLDPALVPPASRAPRLVFRRGSYTQQELAQLHGEVAAQIEAMAPRIGAGGKPAGAADGIRERAGRLAGELARRIPGERDPVLRDTLLVAYFALPGTTDDAAALAQQVIARVPAGSELGERFPGAALGLARAGDTAGRAHAEQVAVQLRSRDRAAMTLFQLAVAADRDGRADDVRRLRRELATRYSDSPMARLATKLDPDSRTRAGRPMPPLDLPSLDDPKARITRDTVRGKLVLVEVWALWCKPCVDEMATLHEVYARFRDRGLAIVSIDLSDTAAAVREFRKAKWPMPWHNAVLEDPKQAEAVRSALGAHALPTSILVDASGTIIATGEALRGTRLADTLAAAVAGSR